MTRSNVNTTAAIAIALAVFAAGCGGDDESAEGVDESVLESRDFDGGIFEAPQEASDDDAFVETDPNTGADAESDLAAPATLPASAATAEETAATAEDVPAATDGSTADAEGGLFGADEATAGESSSDADARFEDNTFQNYGYRDFVATSADPLSTFALDVDTGSYTVARRWLDEGALPPIDAVRPEEFVNAFDYDYRAPRRGLEISVDGGPSPFDPDNHLVRIGVQGEILDDRERGPAALAFVVDTSGSMDRDDRLGLVKRSLTLLVDELDDDDTVAIVTYDDNAGVVLEPTAVADRDTILDAIDRLQPGGSTNLEAGLRSGYALAGESFRSDGLNRVVLASDGVANVGNTDPAALAEMIRSDADRGIDLVTVGFGMGNYNDVTMEQLADQGDGFYAYVDTDDEAERLFEDELTSTLLTIAKDAKIQVKFDPSVVESYRLIGFENRGVRDSEFRNDAVDAGELGAGHQVTAVYEVELSSGVTLDDRGDLGVVFLRWQDPGSGEVVEIGDEVRLRDIEAEWTATPEDFQLATVVASFAELMRDNRYADEIDIDDLADEADRLADVMNDRDVDDLAALIDQAAQLR